MPLPEPSHGDILVQIGELKGQVATLITLVGQKREDINAMFLRLGLLEKDSASHEEVEKLSARVDRDVKELGKSIGGIQSEMAKWLGIGLGLSLLLAFFGPQIQRNLGVIERDATQQTERGK